MHRLNGLLIRNVFMSLFVFAVVIEAPRRCGSVALVQIVCSKIILFQCNMKRLEWEGVQPLEIKSRW